MKSIQDKHNKVHYIPIYSIMDSICPIQLKLGGNFYVYYSRALRVVYKVNHRKQIEMGRIIPDSNLVLKVTHVYQSILNILF